MQAKKHIENRGKRKMRISEILKTEYTNRFANKKLVFLRALLYYYRDPNFRVIVLTRAWY